MHEEADTRLALHLFDVINHGACGELNLQPQQHSTGAIKLCIEVI